MIALFDALRRQIPIHGRTPDAPAGVSLLTEALKACRFSGKELLRI
jgi:hypothetical protein